MRTQKYNLQGIKVFFYILMIAILGWFVFMQLFGANEQNHDVQSHPVVYTQSFYWEKEDGDNYLYLKQVTSIYSKTDDSLVGGPWTNYNKFRQR